MSDKLKDLFETFGSIYSPKKLDEQFNSDKIRTKAEEPLKTDEYYQKTLAIEPHYALSYKYGYVTMALAVEIVKLRKKIEDLENIKVNYELLRGTD